MPPFASRSAILAVVIARHAQQRRRRRLYKLLTLWRARMSLRERNYITSKSLIHPSKCAWTVMYRVRSRKSFINTVSIAPSDFDRLLMAFSRHYTVKSGPGKRGRPPRMVSKNNVLACLLHYYTANVEAKTLCKLFGVPPPTLSRVLNNAESALSKALEELPEASVRWPTKEQQHQWAAAVEAREPLIRGCFCVADGKNYNVQSPTDSDTKNAYYNGWLHGVKVTGVLCYGFDGTLIWGKHNFPGSWNDGEMSYQLQQRLSDPAKTIEGGRCATDSAFPVSAAMSNRIITPLKDGDLERASSECRAGLLAMSSAITSIRQAAEWGMGSVSKCYRQLLLPLPHNPDTRALRLKNIYRLYNFRVRTTGINQIRSVFMS